MPGRPGERASFARDVGGRALVGDGPNGPGAGVLRALDRRWQGELADDTLARVRAGAPEVVEDLLCSLQPRVRQWVYRRLGPDAALDDVSQEVLTEIARALPRFEGRSSLTTFAYRICARVVGRQLKRRRARPERLAADALVDAPADPTGSDADPERAAIERQALRMVLACVQRLPARRREAFILCELEGETPQAAAQLLGISENAVRSRLMHARRELERRLRGRDLEAIARGMG